MSFKSHAKKHAGKQQSNLDFKMMSFFFSLRDKFRKPINKVKKIGIQTGNTIIDYGCGPGSYTIPAAELTGPGGKVYAVDIHPLAIKKVKKKIKKYNVSNIETIKTDCKMDIKDNSIDIIMCFDVFHAFGAKEGSILKEFCRVLDKNGFLLINDHHYQEDELLSKVLNHEIFDLMRKEEDLYFWNLKRIRKETEN